MKLIKEEETSIFASHLGTVLEEKASLLTQGIFGMGIEGVTRKFFTPPPTSPPTKPPKK